MKRTFAIHITIKDGKLTYSMELDRDSTRCFHQAWQDVDGVLHISNTWERDPTFLERMGRKALGESEDGMNVRDIVIAHLKDIGADGLCAEDCGCGLDDFMPCGFERDISQCKPAKAHKCDGACSGCLADESHPIEATCYRPMDTTTEERKES